MPLLEAVKVLLLSTVSFFAALGVTPFVKKILHTYGFHYLDQGPKIIQNVGFVGNIGWYDYTFRIPEKKLHQQQIIKQGKLIDDFKFLDDSDYACKEVHYTDGDRDYFTAWNDREFIRWQFTDKQFLQYCLTKLEEQVGLIYDDVNCIVSATHHLPFENLIYDRENVGFMYGRAFMGSKKIGELLLKYPKVKISISGHSHFPMEKVNGSIRCYNVSNTIPQLTEIIV